MKRWMRKYREQGEFGLMDQRDRWKEYLDQDRYVQNLKRENWLLKKCLVNLKGGSKQERKKSGHGKGSYLRRYTETLLRVWRVPERGVCLFKM